MTTTSREQWSNAFGFYAAAVGSAVGLGNMWRFSYLASENGGAAFVVLYLLLTALIGLPVLLAELVIGRGSGRSPVLALAHYGGARWKPLGALFVATGFLILAYYSVIAGWTLRYAGEALLVGFPDDPAAHFGAISQGFPAFLFHLFVMGLTIGIVASGVTRGIERVSTVAMPMLFVIVCGIALYAASLDGGAEGYGYYLNLDVQNVFSMDVLVAAAGQAFFSLSLGMGAMLTFASYLSRETNLPRQAVAIASSDFGVAFVAGLMVFPIIFALGMEGDVRESTLGALFVALPKAFAHMGVAGRIVGLLFFLTLVIGALTSAISLLEVVVAATVDGLGWPRQRAAVISGLAIAALGAAAAWNLAVLDVMDQIANNLFLLFGGLALALFVGWRMPDAMQELEHGAGRVHWYFAWRALLRFVVPAVLVLVLWHSVPTTFENVRQLFAGGG